MMTSLGERGLPVFQAGHCDWQRPHSVQVAKSSMPFQVKSSILPRPNTSSSPGFSKSIGLPPDSIGSSGPSPSGSRLNTTLIGARKMCKCLECNTTSRKPSMTRDVQHQRDGLDDLVGALTQRMQQVAHEV